MATRQSLARLCSITAFLLSFWATAMVPLGFAESAETPSHSSAFAWGTRPICSESAMSRIHCFSTDMKAAVKASRSDAFQVDFNGLVHRARHYLSHITPSADKVVVVDLDETLLSNVPYYVRHAEQEPKSWTRWLRRQHNGLYHPSVYQLLKQAKAQGFSIMYITGRPPVLAPITLRQTSDIPWDGIYHRPMGLQMNAQTYKTHVRDMLKSMGYTIVLNIGDQVSDHPQAFTEADEQHGEFLLPNALYVIP